MNKFATLLLLAAGSLTFAAAVQAPETPVDASSTSGTATDVNSTYQEPVAPTGAAQSDSVKTVKVGKKAPSHSGHHSHHAKKAAKKAAK